MEAGFMETTAIKMINLAFATENYNARPLTMDVAVIDRYNGQMKLIKLGAAPTFIKRANTKNVEIVYSSSMPAGVFERADIEDMIKDDMTIITTGIWSRDTKNLILT